MINKSNYHSNLLKLFEYKYQTNLLTKEQFFSIKNFIEKNDEKFLRLNINAFESYLHFFPDCIVPIFPKNFEFSFFENLLKLMDLEIPKKISTGWNTLYFTKLVKSVKNSLDDRIIKNSFTNFFHNALIKDFKKKQLKKFSKENFEQIKFLKNSNFNFKKWNENSFVKTYKIPKERELAVISNECSLLVKKALGTKKNPGIIKNNKKAFSRISQFLTNGMLNNIHSISQVIEILKNSSYKLNTHDETIFRNNLLILEKRNIDIHNLNSDVTFSLWERNPAKELFLGSEIDTCLSVTRGSFFCLLDYFMDFFTNIVIIKSNNKIIGLSYLFLMEDRNKNISLLFDNIEFSDEYKHNSFCSKEFIDYTGYVAQELNVNKCFLGINYNDCLLPDLEKNTIYLKKYALNKGKKYYLDTFNGFAIPEGHVTVNLLTI